MILLYLLGAPALVGLAHVGGGLDGGDELEGDVGEADQADDAAGDNAQDAVVEEDGADEDVEDAAAEEAEHEGGIARDLGRDLELEEPDAEAEEEDVGADNDGLAVGVEALVGVTLGAWEARWADAVSLAICVCI